ncbi:F-box/LRR-repeat protein 7-like [Anthonomus grandis grandis]|uniref:F-box/LRR-repeat protein 7-like n=1 Tax=Anthonomus grandis grandis TaxID=2921223 RepID=UPI0021669D81|nr:F-box/LRR-repeat protein 7-like [Anthonomus grandis grandis]XP_050314463.1 F-box/LRR-repeat protein 7-like [Anthonomus grandis grandis]
MNHSSSLANQLSGRPAPCPLVRLGPNNCSTDETNSSTDGGDNNNKYQYEKYTHQNECSFSNKHPTSATSCQTKRHQQRSDVPYEYMQNYYEQSQSYLSEEQEYEQKSEHSSLATTSLKYAKGPIDLSSLCLGSPYWENDEYYSKKTPSENSSQYYLSQNQTQTESGYLFENFGKNRPSSPVLDQGYATLIAPSFTASLWNNENIYKGKKLHLNNSFDKLSDDLVLRIFNFLNSIDLSNCAQVCRRFDNLVWTPCLWRVITIDGEKVSGDRAIKGVLRQLCGQGRTGACPSVEKIYVTNGASLSDKTLLLLAKRCPELTYLQLQGCTNITNNALFEITTRCSNLQHLDLTGCIKISCISVNSIPDVTRRMQLQYLDLTDCVVIQDGGLWIIVQNCPQLGYLYLRRCIQITDGGIKYLPSFCSGLRELSVSDCSNVTDFGLYELAKLGPSLRYLSVAKCDQVSDAGLKVIAKKCYKLRYLNARGCEAVSDDAITVLARSCTRLRALDVGKCDVSDAGLRALAESCPNLKKLSLRNCELVTDRGVQYVAYYCRGLQQLNIQDCQISLEGYRAVKKYCKRCVIEHTNPGFF